MRIYTFILLLLSVNVIGCQKDRIEDRFSQNYDPNEDIENTLKGIASTIISDTQQASVYMLLSETSCSYCYRTVINYLNNNIIENLVIVIGESEKNVISILTNKMNAAVYIYPNNDYKKVLSLGNPIIIKYNENTLSRIVVNDNPFDALELLENIFEK